MSARAAAFWYRTAETLLFLLVFILPVAFYLRTYDSVQVKITALQLGLLAFSAAWLLKGLERGRWELSAAARPLLLPALALAAWMTVRFLAAPHKWAALDGFLRGLAGVAAYCIVLVEFGSQENARRLTGWLLGAAWLVAAYAILQRLGFDPWVWADAFGTGVAFSTLANPDLLGAFLALCAPLAAAQMLDDDLAFWLRALNLLLLPLLALATFWTDSAEAVGAFVVQGLVFCALFPLFFKSRVTWQATGAVGLSLSGLALAWGLAGAEVDRNLRYEAGFKRHAWAGSLRMAAEQPLIGKGPGSFFIHFPRFRAPEIIRMEGQNNTQTSHPESLGLEFAAELGLVGLALAGWLLASLYAAAWGAAAAFRRQGADGERLYLAALVTAVAGYLAAGQFTLGAHFVAPGWLLWPLAGMAAGLAWLAAPAREVHVLPVALGDAGRRWLYVPAAAAFVWLAAYPVSWFQSDVDHNMAIAFSKQQMWDDALEYYGRVKPGAQAYLMARYFRGNVLVDSGRAAEALQEYALVRAQAPDYVQIHHQKGVAYYKLKEYENAVASFKRSAELDPVYPVTYARLAEAARAAGDLEQARRATLAAVRLDPKDPRNWRTLSEIYVAEKRMVAARMMRGEAARTAKAWGR